MKGKPENRVLRAIAKKRAPKTPPKRREVVVPDNWRELPMLTIEQARKLIGIGRNAAYAAAQAKELPAVRFGNSWRVPVPQLARLIDGEAA
jgi:excisionase family DNA binding protein